MPDIIKLLPDSIANQIAAGEVIQRPASVVKELMENAIDAQSNSVQLILKDSGKTLIQVVDNGQGMTETDARKSFARHATSKIEKAADLFSIKTMGFRGEALASIAAIARVELETRLHDSETGTRILITGSEVKEQNPCACSPGTRVSVKNLFYNVPARRKFLKSDPVELKHIMDEFTRIALAYPDIFFSLHHNGNEVYHLQPSKIRQRIVNIFGKVVNEKIIPVDEETDFLKVNGFVGKPEFVKKTKGDQFIFVNQRFIKSNYLAHAIRSAYESLISKDHYPFFVLFLTIDPGDIDINVHPTKHEIKFENERLIYNYIKVSIKHALGKYSLTPTIDFDSDHSFDVISSKGVTSGTPEYSSSRQFRSDQKTQLKHWESIYEGLNPETESSQLITVESEISKEHDLGLDNNDERYPYQLHNSLIISPIKSGFLILDQQACHERILYEKHLLALQNEEKLVQKELFPETIALKPNESELLNAILPKINQLGFQIEDFGKNSYIIHGIPSNLPSSLQATELLEQLLSQYHENIEFELGIDENLARSIACSASIKRGKSLDQEEMKELIDQLFACQVPYNSPTGRKCFISMELDDIYKRFED